MTHEEIFRLISAERWRQDELKAMGKFQYTCADPDSAITPHEKLGVLGEEFGEVARAVNNYAGIAKDGEALSTRTHLRTELIQVAAVCLAWLETL